MQNSLDVKDIVGGHPIKQHVGSRREFAIARADFLTRFANTRICRSQFDDESKFTQVMVGLIDAPTVVGVVPDLFQVCLRLRW